MSAAINYPEIELWGDDAYAVYDAVPALMQLLKDLGYMVDNRVDRMNGRQRFAFESKRNHGFYFAIKDTLNKLIDVDFVDIPPATIINELGLDLKINMFTSFPLTKNLG